MLHHGLAGTEGTGDAGGAALGNGEQGVDDALPRNHRLDGRELACIGARHTHGPLLHQRNLLDGAVLQSELADTVGDLEVAGVQLHDGAALAGRAHDTVEDGIRFLHGSVDIAGSNLVAVTQLRLKVPDLVPIQCRFVDTAPDVGAVLFAHGGQRALDAVINTGQQSGSQLDRQRRTGGNDLVAASQPRRFLVYLDGGAIPVHFDDLTDQAVLPDAHHVEHIGVPHPLGDDKGSGHLQNLSFNHIFLFLLSAFSAEPVMPIPQHPVFLPPQAGRLGASAPPSPCGVALTRSP